MIGQDPVRERMLKEAATELSEAADLLAEHEKAASSQAPTADPIETAKQASLARTAANLIYVDHVNALLAAKTASQEPAAAG
jgi:hypothetical protein